MLIMLTCIYYLFVIELCWLGCWCKYVDHVNLCLFFVGGRALLIQGCCWSKVSKVALPFHCRRVCSRDPVSLPRWYKSFVDQGCWSKYFDVAVHSTADRLILWTCVWFFVGDRILLIKGAEAIFSMLRADHVNAKQYWTGNKLCWFKLKRAVISCKQFAGMLFHLLVSHWAVLLNKKYVGVIVLLCCGTSICKKPLLHQLIEPLEQVRADVPPELLVAGHQNSSFLHNGCTYLACNSMALYCAHLVLALHCSLQLFNPPLNCVWNSEAMLHGSLHPCNPHDIQR